MVDGESDSGNNDSNEECSGDGEGSNDINSEGENDDGNDGREDKVGMMMI